MQNTIQSFTEFEIGSVLTVRVIICKIIEGDRRMSDKESINFIKAGK